MYLGMGQVMYPNIGWVMVYPPTNPTNGPVYLCSHGLHEIPAKQPVQRDDTEFSSHSLSRNILKRQKPRKLFLFNMNHGILHTKSGPSQQEATKSAPWGDTETPLPVNIISLWKSKKNYGAFSFEYNLHLGILVRLPWNIHDLVRKKRLHLVQGFPSAAQPMEMAMVIKGTSSIIGLV